MNEDEGPITVADVLLRIGMLGSFGVGFFWLLVWLA